MTNKTFKFYGLDQIEMPREDRPFYCHFRVCAPSGAILVDFYTNRDLEGRFVYSEDTCTYRQTAGTCQFSLAGIKRKQVYHRLKKMALESLEAAGIHTQEIYEGRIRVFDPVWQGSYFFDDDAEAAAKIRELASLGRYAGVCVWDQRYESYRTAIRECGSFVLYDAKIPIPTKDQPKDKQPKDKPKW
jgi:hypothetical protein